MFPKYERNGVEKVDTTGKWFCLNQSFVLKNSVFTEQNYYDFKSKCIEIITEHSFKIVFKTFDLTTNDYELVWQLSKLLRKI